MSREIKFRAWDKIGKCFLYPYPEGFHLLGEIMAFDLLMQQMYENHPEHRPSLTMLNDIEIMQYTGLKGKNGKEIYDLDWVEVSDGDVVGLYKVSWRNYGWQAYRVEDGEVIHGEELEILTEGKIIGNEYEKRQ